MTSISDIQPNLVRLIVKMYPVYGPHSYKTFYLGGNQTHVVATNLTWLFTHFGYDVRKKNGGISALSSKIIKDNDAISKADADDLLDFLRNNVLHCTKLSFVLYSGTTG